MRVCVFVHLCAGHECLTLTRLRCATGQSLDACQVEAAPGSGSMSARALGLFFFALLTVVAALEKVGLKKATDSMGSFQVGSLSLLTTLWWVVGGGLC